MTRVQSACTDRGPAGPQWTGLAYRNSCFPLQSCHPFGHRFPMFGQQICQIEELRILQPRSIVTKVRSFRDILNQLRQLKVCATWFAHCISIASKFGQDWRYYDKRPDRETPRNNHWYFRPALTSDRRVLCNVRSTPLAVLGANLPNLERCCFCSRICK